MLPDSTFDLLESIAKKHGDGDFSSTTESERKVLDQVNAAIADGDVELYPMKALLAASNDWSTGLITRMGLYKNILLEGIGKGALAPENEYAWEWIAATTPKSLSMTKPSITISSPRRQSPESPSLWTLWTAFGSRRTSSRRIDAVPPRIFIYFFTLEDRTDSFRPSI